MNNYNDDSSHRRLRSIVSLTHARDQDNKSDDLTFLDKYANSNFDGYALTQETSNHLEEMKGGLNSILVAIRVRPLNSKELSISNFETINILDQKLVVLMDPQNEFEREDVIHFFNVINYKIQGFT